VVSFLLAFRPKSYMHSSCPAQLIPLLDHSNYTWRRVQIMKLLIMQFFSNHPSLHFCSVRILSSAPCSQTLLVYVSPLMSKNKFHTHTDPQWERLTSLKNYK
jgi:hypothetical protein